jgi:hypothetical protein
MGCPCKEGRVGAFVTVLCLCFALELGGLPSMLAQVKAGVPFAIGWAILAGCGVLLLIEGVRQALTHDDSFEGGSFLYSVCVIGLSVYGLTHHWYLTDGSTAAFSRALWLSWGASNLFNVWLQLRGQLRGRRPAAPAPEIQQPRRAGRRGFSLRRRRRIEVIEDIEGLGIDADALRALIHHLGKNTPADSFPAVGSDGARPQIVYVPDANGQLIPVALPSPERVRR